MDYEVIVIGGGLAGLTAGALLAKRELHVAVIDKSYNPGGSCGAFKRGDATFDQGSSMLFGFGEKGFNAHRFVFNVLEEPIDIIKHELLYCVNFKGHRIRFFPDIAMFVEELSKVFPSEKENIRRFYRDMEKIYTHVMVEHPSYTTPDQIDKKGSFKAMLRHPISYARFLGFLNKSAKTLLSGYFTDPEIFKFFDKLTSTYCYTTVDESPAILAAVMFVDNHIGGSYYPAGSSLFLPGKLEKVIEEHGGTMLMEKEVVSILFEGGNPNGVLLSDGQKLYAENIVYSGTVWNLYGRLISPEYTTQRQREWAEKQIPTYPSVVLYCTVKSFVIPDDTQPVELLVGNPDMLDESEVTIYIPSVDDRTLCDEKEHVLMAIGPTFESWTDLDDSTYKAKKAKENERLLNVVEKRFPGFKKAVSYSEVATPKTIERYTLKNGGAVAGPKQMLGQHMFKRQHIESQWNTLYCCGESTIMGTGTPTVTTSGISAANAILRKKGMKPFMYEEKVMQYVRLIDPPFTKDMLYQGYQKKEKEVMVQASRCLFCEDPLCSKHTNLDIRGVMRRVSVGNFEGASKLVASQKVDDEQLKICEARCAQNGLAGNPVAIEMIFSYVEKRRD